MKNKIIHTLVLIGFAVTGFGQIVLERKGNIFIQYLNGDCRQITFDSRDKQPLINKANQKIFFIRTIVATDVEEEENPNYTRIIEYDVLKQEEKTLVEGCNPEKLRKPCLSDIDNLWLSPDSDRIYFEASQYATTNSINYHSFTTKKVTQFRACLGFGA